MPEAVAEALERSFDFRVEKAPKGTSDWDHSFYASTGQIDRYGESIDPKAFKSTLKQYLETNPVILFAHNHRNLPVGKTVSASVNDKGLVVKIKWAPTELGQEIKMLYDHGFMSTLSVGFIPQKWVDHTEEERKKGAPWRTYTAVDLLEISAVPVPANPGATINNSVKRELVDFERGLLLADAANLEIEVTRSMYRALMKTDAAAEVGAVPFKSVTGKSGEKLLMTDEAPWNESRERREANALQLVEMAGTVIKNGEAITVLDIHHNHNGAVNRKACVGIITKLNSETCDYPEDVRKEVYEHIRRHLTDDFGVQSEHVAPLTERTPDSPEAEVPDTKMTIELSPELKAVLDGITTGLKGVTDRLTAIEGEQKTLKDSIAALPAPAAPAAKGADANQPSDKGAKSGDDESVVLDFTKEELGEEVDKLADAIAIKLFGAPPKKPAAS